MKKSSLIAIILLVVASIGMTAVFSNKGVEVKANASVLFPDTGVYGSINFSADVVDLSGNFVRVLTDNEASQVTFTVEHTTGISGFSNEPVTQIPSPAHLGQYNNVPASLDTIYEKYLFNLTTSPSGLIIKSINPSYINNLPANQITNVVFHFTTGSVGGGGGIKTGGGGGVGGGVGVATTTSVGAGPIGNVATGDVPYVDYSPYTLSRVKEIARTYSESELASNGSRLTDGDLMMGPSENRIYATGASIAKFGGKPYLFLAAMTHVLVYDISNPDNPIQVSSFAVSSTMGGFGDATRPDVFYPNGSTTCVPNSVGGTGEGSLSVDRVVASDDTPYILVELSFGDILSAKGFAILGVDLLTMNLSAKNEWTYCRLTGQAYPEYANPLGIYKGADGNSYFISNVPTKIVTGDYNKNTIVIYSINSSGQANIKSVLYNVNGGIYKYGPPAGAAQELFNTAHIDPAFIISTVGHSYLMGNSNYNHASTVAGNQIKTDLNVYDITNPSNVIQVDTSNFPAPFKTTYGNFLYDGVSKRLYFYSQKMELNIYDASNFPQLTQLGSSYKINEDIIKIAQTYFVSLKKIYPSLVIPSSLNSWEPTSGNGIFFVISNNIGALRVLLSQDAFNALSAAGAPTYTEIPEFLIDFSDASSPKLIGAIDTINTSYQGTNVVEYPYDMISYGKDIFRMNLRLADVWKIENSSVKNSSVGGKTTSTTITSKISTTTLQTLQQSLFSFQNLLNIFKRIYAK
jgi:hypothetical protein